MFKNVASQKFTVFAFADAGHATLDAGEPVTGDAANITCKVEQDDDGIQSATNDVNPTEVEDGQYRFDLTQAESNGDKLTFYPESSTAGVQVVGVPSSVLYTRPQYFPDLGIESDGHAHADVKEWVGNTVTASAGNPDVNVETIDDIDAPATWKASVNAECDTAISDAALATAAAVAALNDLASSDVETAVKTALEDVGQVLQTGTVTISTQVSFTLSAGSADDDAYNGCMIVIEDASTAAQKCRGFIADYTGASKTVTLDSDPAIFTMATGDKFSIIALPKSLQDWVNGGRLDLLLDAIKAVTDALPDSGALTSLATASALTTVDTVVDAIKLITDALPDSGALTSLATAAALTTVDTVVDAIKVVTDALPDSGALTALLADVAAILVDTGTAGVVVTGTPDVNVAQINGDATAAARLALSAAAILPGTVDAGSFTPTDSIFEADDITEATADHMIGGVIMFITGALQYQRTEILDYELSGANAKFTVTQLTEAPADNDTFIII